MSSDSEEDSCDVPGGQPKFYTRKLQWRSKELGLFLRTLDILYDDYRQKNFAETDVTAGDIGGRQGQFPHARRDTDRPSNRRTFKRELPITAYDPEWLKNQPHMKETVSPKAEAYNFVHDTTIRE